ncbi:hypothetical protein HMPREF1864_01735 [Peptoniphilus sp. DNF00840]|nr:hypothetical protein HMPREF1864_01735 [Peptoniphilus sp. DNF00840]
MSKNLVAKKLKISGFHGLEALLFISLKYNFLLIVRFIVICKNIG